MSLDTYKTTIESMSLERLIKEEEALEGIFNRLSYGEEEKIIKQMELVQETINKVLKMNYSKILH